MADAKLKWACIASSVHPSEHQDTRLYNLEYLFKDLHCKQQYDIAPVVNIERDCTSTT
jgi:hypothetical protein